MTTKPTLSLSVAPRVRETVAPRPPRAEYKVPHVRKDEVEIAAQLLATYRVDEEPVLSEEQLVAFAIKSRDSAYALVQLGWAFAQVEKDHFGDKRWFFDSWVPTMKSAQTEGEQLDIKEGSRVRLSNAEREIVIASIGPMFGSSLGSELCDTVAATIVGKRGSHLRMSLEILRVLNKLESIDEVIKVIRAEAAAAPANAEETSDEDGSDADEEAPAAASA